MLIQGSDLAMSVSVYPGTLVLQQLMDRYERIAGTQSSLCDGLEACAKR